MLNLLAALFFALINNTIIPMDPPKKEKTSDNLSTSKRSRSEGMSKRRSAHFPVNPIKKSKSDEKKRTDKSDLPITNEIPSLIDAFLAAVREDTVEQVQLLLHNKYLVAHAANKQGNTASHLAALDGRFEIIDILLHHSRTKTNVTNKFGAFPQTLLERHRDGASPEMIQKLSIYKEMFFAHATLNTNVEKYALKIYPFYANRNIDQKALMATVNTIKRKINDDKIKQAKKLPTEAQLPAYATDEFILDMLEYDLALLGNPKK